MAADADSDAWRTVVYLRCFDHPARVNVKRVLAQRVCLQVERPLLSPRPPVAARRGGGAPAAPRRLLVEFAIPLVIGSRVAGGVPATDQGSAARVATRAR
jgi:hypothetical protein